MKYGQVSDLKLNTDKTKGIWLGVNKDRNDSVENIQFNFWSFL